MENVEFKGVISEEMNKYYLTTKDGTKYVVYAISPWESVPTDFDTAKFAQFVGETVTVSGRVKGTEIWSAVMHCPDNEDIKAPKIDDLLSNSDKK